MSLVTSLAALALGLHLVPAPQPQPRGSALAGVVTDRSSSRPLAGATIELRDHVGAIAARAGKQVVDHGLVQRSIGKRVLGVTSAANENTPLDAASIETINRSHARNVRTVVIGLALLLVAGIGIDFATASRTTFAEFGAFGPRIDANVGTTPAKKR